MNDLRIQEAYLTLRGKACLDRVRCLRVAAHCQWVLLVSAVFCSSDA